MTDFNEWLLILGMTLVTFGVRYPVLAVFSRITFPEPVSRALRFVPVAVLTAIVVPALLLTPDNQLNLRVDNAYLVAGMVSIIVAWRTQKLLPTIVIGMTLFVVWRALTGV